ncbi:MAG TPA: GBS Bsp-like repeat-containing protein [Candidatus Alectryocaccobium stercorigallinarum]|nr:GBS Bsp-like repeat-containing protein [Candidatus Alectryocaccobium stercorigallinarum]
MGKKIRILSFVLCFIMACSICVHAEPSGEQGAQEAESCSVAYDNGSGSFDVEIYGVKDDEAMQQVEVAVWSDNNWQDDLRWYNAAKQDDGTYSIQGNISKHGYDTGLYYFDVYKHMSDGTMVYSSGTTVTYTVSECDVNIEKSGSNYNVSLNSISVPGGVSSVKYAVWSDVNKQADLIWYNGAYNASNGTSSLTYKSSDFKAYGKYYVDVYAVNKAGTYLYLGGDVYYVNLPSAESVELSADNAAGKFTVKASGVVSDLGIKKVQVAVWSDAGWQDDLVWYDLTKQGDSYVLNGNISRHGYDTGLYYFDVYVQDPNGGMGYIDGKTFTFSSSSGKVSVEKNSTNYNVSLKDIVVAGGVKEIKYAVWSDAGWQDDLIWYTGKYDSKNGTSSLTYKSTDFNTLGKYYIDVYGYNKANEPVFLSGTTYSVDVASAKETKITTDNSKGTFKVSVDGVSAEYGVQKIQVAVWSDNNWQDDLVWYDASKQGSGYVLSRDLSKHGYDTGLYYIDVYVKDSRGNMQCVASETANFTVKSSEVSVEKTDGATKYKTSISDVEIPGGVKTVRFAVWSDEGWQDDLAWYTGSKSGNVYSAVFDIAKHGSQGLYYIDVYAETASGKLVYLNGAKQNFGNINIPVDTPDISCTITGGNTVQVVLSNVTTSGTYGLFALEAGKDYISPNDVPVAEASGSGSVTLNAPLNLDTADSLLTSKFVVGIKQNDGYWQASSGFYITNPEAVAENTFAFPTTENKKGLQINYNITEDAIELGANHTVVNVPLNTLFYNGSVPYKYNGETYYFSADYIRQLDTIMANMASNGIITSFILLLQYDSQSLDLILPGARTAGHPFYAFNTVEEEAAQKLEAAFTFLAERYSTSNVVNWILANEVDDYTQYYYCGNASDKQAADYYTDAYRLLYNCVKSVYSNARIYISLDHAWTYDREGAMPGKDMLEYFTENLEKEGDITWCLAYHPYPSPITNANFWNTTSSYVTNSINSGVFTMKNLTTLTDYIRDTYGSEHRIILSETGFTSVSDGKKDETLQAAAITYAYYLAEFNDMVDSFIVHRHVDHKAEMAGGLYLGVWNNDSAYDEQPTSKKFSWQIYKYMDSPMYKQYTNFALTYIGASSWESLVPGFDGSIFR